MRLRRRALHEIQKVATVGKDLRPAMRRLVILQVDLGERLGLAPRLRHAVQAALGRRREQDETVATPRPAAAVGGGSETAWRSASEFDSLQRPGGEEPDRLTIRRPEWVFGPGGAGERLRLQRVE